MHRVEQRDPQLRPWYDISIDNPDAAFSTSILKQLSLEAFEVAPTQTKMNQILRQAKEVPAKPKKEKKEKQGYIQISNSDLELIDFFDQHPDLDPNDPDRTIYTPSIEVVMGQLRGVEGHVIDNLYIDLLRHFRQHIGIKSKADLSVPMPANVLANNRGLRQHERECFSRVAQDVLGKYSRYTLTDIPNLVNELRQEWRKYLVFYQLKKRRPRSKNVPKDTTKFKKISSVKEGWAWSAGDVQSLWLSTEQEIFIQGVLHAQQAVIEHYLNGDVWEEDTSLPLETMATLDAYYEQEIRHKIKCGDHDDNDLKLQITVKSDYFLRKHRKKRGMRMVFVTKFGPWEDSISQELQRAEYCAAFAGFSGNGTQENVDPTIDLDELDPTGIEFYYRVFDPYNPNGPAFSYIPKSIDPSRLDLLKETLVERGIIWRDNKENLTRIKNDRLDAAVMPYIPDKHETVEAYQTRLF